MDKLRVGFIGLGLMGTPMAKNILKKGYPLVVFNRTIQKTVELKRFGATVAQTPKELASIVDVVITMVTGPKEVRKLLLGKNGVVEGSRKGLIVIDMSTIGKKASQEIGEDLKNFGIHFLDAPVTGSVNRAVEGTLTIFIGGERVIYKKVEEIFSSMGNNLQYIGGIGMGQAMKLVNNLLIGESLVALAEGMLLADSMDLSRQKVADALDETMTMSPAMRMKIPNMIKEKFPTAFSLANMTKDLKLATGELTKKLPVLNLVKKLYLSGVKQNFGDEDNSAILKVISEEIKR